MNSELERQYKKYQVSEGFYEQPSKIKIFVENLSNKLNLFYENFRLKIIRGFLYLVCLFLIGIVSFSVYKTLNNDRNVYLNLKSDIEENIKPDFSEMEYEMLKEKHKQKDFDLGRFSGSIDRTKLILNSDGTYDYDGDLDLQLMQLKSLLELPFRLRNVNGSFNCLGNDLISLEGCPEKVGYSFYCNGNNLITTQYLPESVPAKLQFDGDVLLYQTTELQENIIESFLRMNRKQQLKELEYLKKMKYASYEKMLKLFNGLNLECE